jgi:rfaE bifunctional protein kinase chain/domain
MTRSLSDWLDAVAGKRILVWGDLVADHTVYGDTRRISREAPVLILKKEWEGIAPGCAGNAVMNVSALGGTPVPVGIVGDDAAGESLLSQFTEHGVDVSHILRQKDGETAVKMRVLAGGLHTVKQQVIRIDSDGSYGSLGDGQIEGRLRETLEVADAVIVSDYGLGTVRELLFTKLIRRRSLPSVIDSRHALDRFGGATSATPNEPELEELTRVSVGDEDDMLERAARKVLRELQLKALVVTRGKRGMALFEPRKRRVHIPVSRVREIVDVTGAGDTVIAAYTLALAAGAPYPEAARLANVAAGVAVMKRGAVAPSASEVAEALQDSRG